MKATGIVRRIDDLGRVVIPKEIRRTLRIREGDPLEIFTDKEGGVIFKKYSQLGGVSDFAGQLCDTMSKAVGQVAVITDRDSCLAVGGASRRELTDKRVNPELERLMDQRKTYQASSGSPLLPEFYDRVVGGIRMSVEGLARTGGEKYEEMKAILDELLAMKEEIQ